MDRVADELDILESISGVLSSGVELHEVFERTMALLSDRLSISRAALVLMDPGGEQYRCVASVGMSADERRRASYAPGEGVTGRVIATGEAALIADVSAEPEFLDRVGGRVSERGGRGEAAVAEDSQYCFVCVPILDGRDTVGAMSFDKVFEGEEALARDARLMRIIAGSISQTYREHKRAILERGRFQEEAERLREDLRTKYRFDNIIGSSPVMLDVLNMIGQVAGSRATVLLLGETGCGKELIAKAIHYNSPRADRPLIRVNCGALSPQLLESELFGHVKGAFTGATRDKLGRFEAADGGTIFLDEIGTMDPQMQVKLLRVLQERELERVGDHQSIKVDVRVIAATNLDLQEETRKGTFREDLYYRLNVVTINLPPLRNRREDIPQLLDHFLERYSKENNRQVHQISREVMNTLMRYPWPGNVRELENAVERAVVLATGEELSLDLLPLQIRMFSRQTRGESGSETLEGLSVKLAELAVRGMQAEEGAVYDAVVQEVERQVIREALSLHDGVKLRAADYLGINRNTLNKKVRELAIEEDLPG